MQIKRMKRRATSSPWDCQKISYYHIGEIKRFIDSIYIWQTSLLYQLQRKSKSKSKRKRKRKRKRRGKEKEEEEEKEKEKEKGGLFGYELPAILW